MMGCGLKKVGNLLAELDSRKGIGLITRIRQGLGKPDRIYVRKCTQANYNMIDGLMNNTPKKKDKNAPRRSVLKRLRKHQQKIASQGKGQPQQQRAVEEEMERKKK